MQVELDKRVCKITTRSVAEAADVPMRTAMRDKSQKKFALTNLRSIACYVVSSLLSGRGETARRPRGLKPKPKELSVYDFRKFK